MPGTPALRHEPRQALVVTSELVGLGALGGDLPFQLGQQAGALFLLRDQRGFLFGGLGDPFFDFGAAFIRAGLQRRGDRTSCG